MPQKLYLGISYSNFRKSHIKNKLLKEDRGGKYLIYKEAKNYTQLLINHVNKKRLE